MLKKYQRNITMLTSNSTNQLGWESGGKVWNNMQWQWYWTQEIGL